MTQSLAPSVTARDSKGNKFISIVEQAYNKAKLSEDEAQRVNDTSGLSDLIAEFIAENRTTGKYKDEEVQSRYGYLSGYKKPKGIVEQTNILRALFPGIGFVNQDLLTQIEKGEVNLPENAEGWFAIPNWVKNPEIFGNTYGEALQVVLNKIKETRKGNFKNFREGELDEKHLRMSMRTGKFFHDLSMAQGQPDILIVPGQFGFTHRGRSVRRAREVFTENEFGLGAFAVGCMLLTHENRLNNYDDLYIDCAGDEFSPYADGDFSSAPLFVFFGGRVEFNTVFVGSARDHFGSASGLSPQ